MYTYRAQILKCPKEPFQNTYLLDIDLGFGKWEPTIVVLSKIPEKARRLDWIVIKTRRIFDPNSLEPAYYTGEVLSYEPRRGFQAQFVSP